MVIKGLIHLIALSIILFVFNLPIVDATSASYEVNEQEMRQFLSEVFEVDKPENYGFTTVDVDKMSFGDPIPVYNIPASFAFGESDEIIQGKAVECMAVIYEKEQPINGMKLKINRSDQLEVVGFGYPVTLAAEVVQLDKEELLLYEFQTGYYYAFNQETNTVKLLEKKVAELEKQIKELSKEEFQSLLEERYDHIETTEKRTNNQPNWLYFSVSGAALLLLVVFWKGKKL